MKSCNSTSKQQTRANIAAGMTPKEAHRQAVIAFGGVERAKKNLTNNGQAISSRPLFRTSATVFAASVAIPVFTITIVATLMLGIGATTAVFSVVDRILFRPLPYANADRLVSVGMVHSLETEFMLGYFYYDWQRNQKPFEALTSEDAVTGECDLTERNPAQLNCSRWKEIFYPRWASRLFWGATFYQKKTLPNGPRGSSHLLRPMAQSLQP